MKSFSVHQPPVSAGLDPVLDTRFVKDGFAWPALFIPIIWMLWHRMWLVLVAYLIGGAGVSAALIGAVPDMAMPVLILFGVLFAWEANNLRRWSLGRRGWRELAAAYGRNRAEAEIRYFLSAMDATGPSQPSSNQPGVVPAADRIAGATGSLRSAVPGAGHRNTQRQSPALARQTDEPPVVGLFPKSDP